MLKVLLDINVIRTVLLEETRQGDPNYHADAKAVWKAVEDNIIEGYIAAFSVPILFSQCETYHNDQNRRKGMVWDKAKTQARLNAYRNVRQCLSVFGFVDLLSDDLFDADALLTRNVSCDDYEDNLQLICAFEHNLDIIVTDNVRDFDCAGMYSIEVLTPAQLLRRI